MMKNSAVEVMDVTTKRERLYSCARDEVKTGGVNSDHVKDGNVNNLGEDYNWARRNNPPSYLCI